MRACEFLLEKVVQNTTISGFEDSKISNDGLYKIIGTGETKDYSGYKAHVLHVKVLDNDSNKQLAWADFLLKKRYEDNEEYLESVYTYINPDYRGKGLAKLMYKYVNDLGNDVQPSELQTKLGKNMWQGLSKTVKQLPKSPISSTKPIAKKTNFWDKIRKTIS